MVEGWWRWALVGPDGVVPSRMVSVSASVNLPLMPVIFPSLQFVKLLETVVQLSARDNVN